MYVKQKEKTDCGIACLAMLVDISYTEAKSILFGGDKKKYSTKTRDIVMAVYQCPDFKVNGSMRLRPARGKDWKDLPDNSLVKVVREYHKSNEWHWVVWRNKKIYDPSRGVFKPKKFDKQPVSFIHVIHLQDT